MLTFLAHSNIDISTLGLCPPHLLCNRRVSHQHITTMPRTTNQQTTVRLRQSTNKTISHHIH
jgi:hypothetical protein